MSFIHIMVEKPQNYAEMMIEINPITALAPWHGRLEKISPFVKCTKAIRMLLLSPSHPPRTGGGFLHHKNSWQINALPLGLIKLEGIKTTERLLWWTQCCASCTLCSGGEFLPFSLVFACSSVLDLL